MTIDNIDKSSDVAKEPQSIYGYLTLLVRRRIAIFAFAVFGIAAGAGLAWLTAGYVASASILAEDDSGQGSATLDQLASQFGLQLGSPTGASGPVLLELLQDRSILADVVNTTYTFRTDPYDPSEQVTQGAPVDLWDVSGTSPQARTLRAIKRLLKHIDVTLSPESGIITLRVFDREGGLALAMTRHMLDRLNEFNVSQRKNEGAIQATFISARLTATTDTLHAAESALQKFWTDNRDYENSPGLRIEADRLQRQVDLFQGITLTLAQALEQARIQAVRDTPVMTIIDSPENSVKTDTYYLISCAIGLLLGAGLGIAYVISTSWLYRTRAANVEEYNEFLAASDSLRHRFGRLRHR